MDVAAANLALQEAFPLKQISLKEEPVDVPTDQEALQGLEIVIGWLEAQQDVEQVKIMQLVSLKNMILKKDSLVKNNKKLLTF
jgi:hypothetical protein